MKRNKLLTTPKFHNGRSSLKKNWRGDYIGFVVKKIDNGFKECCQIYKRANKSTRVRGKIYIF